MNKNNLPEKQSNFILYTGNDEDVNVEVFLQDENIWLTQKAMSLLFETFYYLLEWFGKPQSTQRKIRTLCVLCALCGEYFMPRFIYPEYIKKSLLFGVESHTITYHLKEIFKSGELNEKATTRKIRVVQNEGKRQVTRKLDFYNLDAIISVGYRVNSYHATQFRIWATKTLKEYIIKGFVLDDERPKQGNQVFGRDYFNKISINCNQIRTLEKLRDTLLPKLMSGEVRVKLEQHEADI